MLKFRIIAIEAAIKGTTHYHRNKEVYTMTTYETNKTVDNNIS